MADVDFDRLAASYDRLRPVGEDWRELSAVVLGRLAGARRVLDVGCGTGAFALEAARALGARVWGIDPSAEMLARARTRPGARRVGWRQARAEQLPFRDGWFDGAYARLVVHLLDDRPRALAELRRVLAAEAPLVIATFRPEHFRRFFLGGYFPSLAAIDLARFPPPDQLMAELHAAGFEHAGWEPLDQSLHASAAEVLERAEGRYISTLHLVGEDEYRRGLAALRADLAGRREAFDYRLRWAIVTAG